MSEIRAHPYIAVRNSVFYPSAAGAISVGRSSSVAALKAALTSEDKTLVLLTQRDPSQEEPGLDDLYALGIRATVQAVAQGPNGYDVVFKGAGRVRLTDLAGQPYPIAQVELLPAFEPPGEIEEELSEQLLEESTRYFDLSGPAGVTPARLAARIDNPEELVSFIAGSLKMPAEQGMKVLGAADLEEAQRLTLGYLTGQIELLEMRGARPGYLRWKSDDEEEAGGSVTVEILRDRVTNLVLPVETRIWAMRELEKLERLEFDSVDYHNVLTGLELFLELPIDIHTHDNLDLAGLKARLDEQIFGQERVKERLLDEVAVMELNPLASPPALWLCGPPGSGKSSLARTVAGALGRQIEFVRLEGQDQDGQFQGRPWHQPGATLGRLFEALRRAGTANPVLVIEARDIDTSAVAGLLEALDPGRNRNFRDRYLGIPLDLSAVLFVVCTDSQDALPRPLQDRLEKIVLDGYSDAQKRQLAQHHIWPRQLQRAGLEAQAVELSESTLDWLIDGYTSEAGVAQLDLLLGRVATLAARRWVEHDQERLKLDATLLRQWLGAERSDFGGCESVTPPGEVAALALTRSGAQALVFEALKLPARHDLLLTGAAGEILKEAATIARSQIWARSRRLACEQAEHGWHLHLPGEILVSDAPAAALPLAVSLASACAGMAVDPLVGLAGKISLSGRVFSCGDVRERVLAARRAGLTHLILPLGDQDELRGLPASFCQGLRFTLVEDLEQALVAAVPNLAPSLALKQEAIRFGGALN